MTFIRIVNIRNEAGMVNTDHIQSVDFLKEAARLSLIGAITITLSLEEFARIEPLLTQATTEAYLKGREHGYDKAFEYGSDWQKAQAAAEPDRAAPVLPSGEWQTTFDQYLARWYALKSNGSDRAYSLPAQQSSNDAYATLLGHCATGYKPTSYPAALVSAYHHLRACESGRYTGVTEAKIDMFRRDVIDKLGALMPAEKEATDE